MDDTTFGISDKFLDKCLSIFVHADQLDILQEECAELIQACSKVKRDKPKAMENLREELAHVLISSAILAKIYGITEEDIALEVKKKNDKYLDKDYIPEPMINRHIHVDKFDCANCGKPVLIQSNIVDGSVYDYLCPECYTKRYKTELREKKERRNA